MKNINENDFSEIINNSDLAVVKFGADWCMPCKRLDSEMEKVDEEVYDIIYKVNVDESPNLASEYGVMSIPTTLVFKNGEVVDKLIGVVGKDVLEDTVSMYI